MQARQISSHLLSFCFKAKRLLLFIPVFQTNLKTMRSLCALQKKTKTIPSSAWPQSQIPVPRTRGRLAHSPGLLHNSRSSFAIPCFCSACPMLLFVSYISVRQTFWIQGVTSYKTHRCEIMNPSDAWTWVCKLSRPLNNIKSTIKRLTQPLV